MEGLLVALEELRMVGREGFSIIFVLHRYPMLFVLPNRYTTWTKGSDSMVSRQRKDVLHIGSAWGGVVLERDFISIITRI